MMACGVRRGVRRDSAGAAHRARPAGGAALARTAQEQTISGVQSFQEFGGLAGRILLAALAAVIIGRRKLLHVFQVPGLILLPLVFFLVPSQGLRCVQWGIFLVGLATIAQFSFWGNYLPRVYPTHLRGTGESFAANVGGRMIGTMAALRDHIARGLDAGRFGADQARLRRRDRRHVRLRDRRHRQLLAA